MNQNRYEFLHEVDKLLQEHSVLQVHDHSTRVLFRKMKKVLMTIGVIPNELHSMYLYPMLPVIKTAKPYCN